MAGEFDDLIPKKKGGEFDDLIPKKGKSAPQNPGQKFKTAMDQATGKSGPSWLDKATDLIKNPPAQPQKVNTKGLNAEVLKRSQSSPPSPPAQVKKDVDRYKARQTAKAKVKTDADYAARVERMAQQALQYPGSVDIDKKKEPKLFNDVQQRLATLNSNPNYAGSDQETARMVGPGREFGGPPVPLDKLRNRMIGNAILGLVDPLGARNIVGGGLDRGALNLLRDSAPSVAALAPAAIATGGASSLGMAGLEGLINGVFNAADPKNALPENALMNGVFGLGLGGAMHLPAALRAVRGLGSDIAGEVGGTLAGRAKKGAQAANILDESLAPKGYVPGPPIGATAEGGIPGVHFPAEAPTVAPTPKAKASTVDVPAVDVPPVDAPQVKPFAEPPAADEINPATNQPWVARLAANYGSMDAELERRGMAKYLRPTRQNVESWVQQAQNQGMVKDAMNIAQEVIAKPRNLSNVETAALAEAAQRNADEVNRLATLIANETDPGVIESLTKSLDRANMDLYVLSDAINVAGTEWGRAGVARRLTLAEDYTYAGLMTKHHGASRAKLSPEVDQVFRNISSEIETNQAKQAAEIERLAAIRAQKMLDEMKAKRGSVNRGKAAEQRKFYGQQIKEKLAQANKEAMSRLSANPVDVAFKYAAIAPDVAQYLRYWAVEAGEVTLESATKALRELIPGIEDKDAHQLISGVWVPRKTREKLSQLEELRKAARATEGHKAGTINKRIAKLEAELQTGDFTEKAVREVMKTPELEKLKIREASLKNQADEIIKEARMERARAEMTGGDKAKAIFKDVLGAPTSLIASTDASFFGNQGIFALMSHPGIAVSSLVRSFKGMSKKGAAEINAEIRAMKNFDLARASKLAISDGAVDDFFVSSLMNKVPVISQTQRLYEANAKLLRMRLFDKYVKWAESPILGKGRKLTLEEAKNVASIVNIMTGRGVGQSADKLASLNTSVGGTLLFGPRYFVSRWQLLNPATMYKLVKGTGSKSLAVGIVSDYAKVAALAYSMVQASGGVTDPRSSYFGKVRVGDQWVDPFGGMLTPIRVMAQFMGGRDTQPQTRVRKSDGKRIPVYGNAPMDTLGNYLLSKSGPLPRLAESVFLGMNKFNGEPVGFGNAEEIQGLAKQFAPMSPQQISEIWQDAKLSREQKLAFTILSVFGVNINEARKKS